MNKKTLFSVFAVMGLAVAGWSLPQAASAHEGAHGPVGRYVQWHTTYSRQYAPDFRHYGKAYREHEGRYRRPGLVRKRVRELDRRGRWADLTPRERRILRREMDERKAHRRDYRRDHRVHDGYHSHRDERVGLYLEYDKWL